MKIMKKLAGITTLLAMCISFTQAELEAAPKLKDWTADPASHVVKIERITTKADDAKWITAAEMLPVDASALRKAAARKMDAKNPNAIRVADKQWWYMAHKEQETVKIPFAVTAEAVTYYSELVTGFGKKNRKAYFQPSSHFTYEARVSHKDEFTIDESTFRNVTVVSLHMDFEGNYTTAMATTTSFTKDRVVVFDKNGKVLHTSGDGETENTGVTFHTAGPIIMYLDNYGNVICGEKPSPGEDSSSN